MNGYKNYIKVLLENTFALGILVSIILIAVVGVLSLNPRATTEINDTNEDLSVSDIQSNGQIIIDTKYQEFRHEMSYFSKDNSVFYKIIPKSLSKGELNVDWVEINNLYSSDKFVKFIPTIQGNDWDLLNLNIIYNGIKFPLIENGETKELELNIPASNISPLQLQYSLEESLNYPIEINLEVQY